MSTPYVTPAVLVAADTGIDWGSLIPNASPQTQLAEQTRICLSATQMADSYCNQILRATQDTESVDGPDDRAVLLPNGILRVRLSRWPVISIIAVNVAVKSFPLTYNLVPAGQYYVRNYSSETASGQGAYSIEVAPGYVDWSNGRGGYDIQIQYQNGWPHAGLTAGVTAGSTSQPVDDCTGFAVGDTVTIYDGALTEQVTVSAVSTSTGPGTLTTTATVNAHVAGTIITELPLTVQQACIYIATHLAMTRGSTAIAIPATHGFQSAGKPDDGMALLELGYTELGPYRRVI